MIWVKYLNIAAAKEKHFSACSGQEHESLINWKLQHMESYSSIACQLRHQSPDSFFFF